MINNNNERMFIYHVFINHDPKKKDSIGFCSTIQELINQLDYIEFMGFNTVMSNPLFPCKSYHGYDITDFYNIDPNIGTMKDFEELLSELDKRNMKFIFDITLAHTADIHPWFLDYVNGKNNYYMFKDKIDNDISTDMHPTIHFYRHDYKRYLLGAFGGHMPSLNVQSESLKKEIKKILQFWISKGNNLGLRLDAIYYNRVTALNHDGIPYCEYIRKCVDEINPNCILIGEIWDNKEMLNKPVKYSEVLGNVFDFYNSFGIINQVNQGIPYEKIKIENPYKRSTIFSCNHDTTRLYTMLNNDINKVKTVLKAMILKTNSDISIYYGTEGNWYGMVCNGNDLPVRSKMDYEHMGNLISGKYNSLIYYIKDLIAQAKNNNINK